jgi:hypothetical protein
LEQFASGAILNGALIEPASPQVHFTGGPRVFHLFLGDAEHHQDPGLFSPSSELRNPNRSHLPIGRTNKEETPNRNKKQHHKQTCQQFFNFYSSSISSAFLFRQL